MFAPEHRRRYGEPPLERFGEGFRVGESVVFRDLHNGVRTIQQIVKRRLQADFRQILIGSHTGTSFEQARKITGGKVSHLIAYVIQMNVCLR